MLEELKQAFVEHNEKAILNFIQNEQYVDILKANPWEIIPHFVQNLNKKTAHEYPNFYRCIISTLNTIPESVDPDDIVLIVIKEIQDVSEDTTFLLLLKLLEEALIKLLPKNKINYLAWSLNAVQTYLKELPAPENYNLQEKEKLLMDADLTVDRISKLYYDMIPFYDKITSIIKTNNDVDHKILLLKSLLQLFGHPLLYLDMDISDKPKSKARLVSENLIIKVIEIQPDTYKFLDEEFCTDHEDIKITPISLSVFYYLHFAEYVGLANSPKVYNPIFIFQNTLPFVVNLLTMDHQFVLEKGLKLMFALLQTTSNLPYQLLDSDIHSKFCKSMTNIIIYNSMESYRKNSLKLFHDYLYKFDYRGRYLLIYNITKCVDNISLTSYIITQYKQMLVEQFQKSDSMNPYYRGSKLATLLSMFCHLQNGVETDLVKSADQIVATLNLLRYLVIRDKTNLTDIWNNLKQLQKSFLEPLWEALILSKAHYNLKLKELTDENVHGNNVTGDDKVSVSIEGKHLPDLTQSEKLSVINLSVTAFDVIESLLSRLNECIEYGYSVRNEK